MKIRLCLAALLSLGTATLHAADRKLVMIAGPVSHPPLMHEFKAGSLLLQKRLEGVAALTQRQFRYLSRAGLGFIGLLGVAGLVWLTVWGQLVDGKKVDDNSVFEGAAAVFIYSDGGGNHPGVQPDRLGVLGALVKKGVGIGMAHYAVEVLPNKGGPEWKDWIGGHYENSFSCNPIWDADYQSFPVHPITRGVKPFKAKDEWYFNMRFREGKTGVKDILVATPSDAVRDGPYVHPKGP